MTAWYCVNHNSESGFSHITSHDISTPRLSDVPLPPFDAATQMTPPGLLPHDYRGVYFDEQLGRISKC